MNPIPHLLTVPLTRPGDYVAYIRAADTLQVIFAPASLAPAEVWTPATEEMLRTHQPPTPPLPDKRTLTVYLSLTELCNLRCRYCDVLDKVARQPDRQAMTWETAQAALDVVLRRLAADPALKAQIVFFGGEPLLNWPVLAQLCEAIADHPFQPRLEKMLVTNGALVDREKAEFLARHAVYTVVSLDGRAAANDLIRQRADGSGSYAAVAAGLAHLTAAMPDTVGISCTVGSHNVATLAEELRFLQETFHPCSIGINFYHYLADGGNPAQVDDAAQVAAFLAGFRAAREEGIGIYQFIGVLRAFVQRRQNRDYCPACLNKLLFTPRGTVGRCETLVFYEPFAVPVQTLVNGELPPRLDWTRYTPDHEPACQMCAARWICPGSCVYDQFIRTGELGGVEEGRRCAFHRQFLQELLALVYAAARAESPDAAVLVPAQRHFESSVGRIPMSFPEHTV